MPRNESYDWESQPQMNRQRDLVLSTNEFCFLQSKTNGAIKTYTGPITMTISAQESLVIFNSKTKKFEETQDFEKAKQLFVSAPEGWYVVLKNPAKDNIHPELAKAVNGPDLEIGRKINIAGPVSFSLFPGQMTRVIKGHRLRSNQYLIARVYDADAAKAGVKTAQAFDSEGKEVTVAPEEYFVGQLIVIKGTEVSFYIPPTGIEVIPVEESGEYVREAVTLERLEYAILKDEDGEKRYIHGPAVVFPKPTETFVTAPKGGLIFRALELSPISGIYVKVIAEYTEEKEKEKIIHPIGEELFITGKDQMIYYPRPEHAMIQYDGKYMHHAIAIPKGEGRYILNRLTGEITTVCGPQMYLPDPRTEVVVKRKLTPQECALMYPNNMDVLAYNEELSEKKIEKMANRGLATNDVINCAYSTANQESALAIFEANANISRGTSYTKPRTITLDTRFDGAVSLDIWSGYAINVVSKSGKRDVIVGPATRLLDYDETVEAIELSTGQPKSTDITKKTAFLKIENNRISDVVDAQTSDFVDVQIKLRYCVDFLEKYKNKWFSIDNYIKYLCENMRSLIKREIKLYDIKDFYANSTEIIRNIVLDIPTDNENDQADTSPFGRLFSANGMNISDVDILNISMERSVADMLQRHQADMIQKRIELADEKEKMDAAARIAEMRKKKEDLDNEAKLYSMQLRSKQDKESCEHNELLRRMEAESKMAAATAQRDMQALLTEIQDAELNREKAKHKVEIEHKKQLAEIEKAKNEAYATTIKEIMESISPDLVAAISASSKADLLKEGMKNMSPYAIANGESVADTVNKLMRGTSLEDFLDKASPAINY